MMNVDYLQKFRLDGKTAAVCGGLGLIGKAITTALAEAGAQVIVLDVQDEQGNRFADECRSRNLKVSFVHFDCTVLEQIESSLNSLEEHHGPLHVWVNASYPRTQDWGAGPDEITATSWEKNISMQLTSYCITALAVAKRMQKNRIPGSIISLGSIYGMVGNDFTVYEGTDMTCSPAYAAIKGGIANLTRYLAAYYGRAGIRVNCVCPGGIFNNQNETFVKNYSRKVPLSRMGKQEEVASVVLFAASDAASYVTGATLMVDGGWTSI